ncbi:MAG: hypothetical protein ACOH5I_18875 [Oligoflexus sp.]
MGIRLKRLAETWNNRKAIAYSSSAKSMGLMLKDILSKRDWRLIEVTSSVDEIFANLAIGNASLLIIDDAPDDPAALILRQQLFDPVAAITPTLLICSQHNDTELQVMQSMGEPILVRKPLTPKDFVDAFDRLIEKWSSGYLVDVRKAAAKMGASQVQSGFKILTEIVQSGKLAPIASAALSLYYRQNQDLAMTERVLQAAIRQGVFEMTIILPLIDLYLYSGCPAMALELIDQANQSFGNPNFLCIDAVQANVLLNRVKECTPYLKQMTNNDYFADVARHYLPRIVYSSGQLDEFDKSIKYRPERFDEYQRAWHLLSDSDAKRRRAQYEQVSQIKKARAREDRLKQDSIEKEPQQKVERQTEESTYTPIGQPLFKKINQAS